MRRICDQPSEDRETAEVAELLSCARVDDPPAAVKQRVWRALAEPTRRARRGFFLRPAFLLLALLIAGVATAGTLLLMHRLRDQRPVQPSQEAAVHAQPAAQNPPARQEQPVPHQRPASTLAVDSPTSLPTAPARTSRPDGVRRAHVHGKPAVTRPEQLAAETVVPAPMAPVPPVAAKREEAVSGAEIVRLLARSKPAAAAAPQPSPPEAELVLEATLALRERHDPRGSLVFLRTYLQQYPTGALIEESMALAMEAMAALDDRAAGQIGSDYLQRYPSGRFGALAKTAVRRFGR